MPAITVWDMQGFRGSSQGLEEASAQIKETALWRGHQSIVSSLDWVDGGSNGLCQAASNGIGA
eukprot:scaffold212200_cov23-Tisochrysis_lutea.AAC.3